METLFNVRQKKQQKKFMSSNSLVRMLKPILISESPRIHGLLRGRGKELLAWCSLNPSNWFFSIRAFSAFGPSFNGFKIFRLPRIILNILGSSWGFVHLNAEGYTWIFLLTSEWQEPISTIFTFQALPQNHQYDRFTNHGGKGHFLPGGYYRSYFQ